MKLTSVTFDISLLCQQAKNNDSKQKNKLEIVQESLKKNAFLVYSSAIPCCIGAMDVINKLYSTVSSTVSQLSSVLPGNPVSKDFEIGEHIASAGPGVSFIPLFVDNIVSIKFYSYS